MEYRYLWPEAPEAHNAGIYSGLPDSLPGLLLKRAQKSPDKIALIDGEIRRTYAQLWEESGRAAILLRQQGLEPKDRVVLRLANSWRLVVWVLGIMRAGGIAVPINYRFRDYEWATIAKVVRPRIVVGGQAISQDALVLSMDPEAFERVSASTIGTVDFSGPGVGLLFMTSGTTGTPKAVALTHENILTSAATYCRIFDLTSSDSTLVAVPLCHVTGFVGQLVALLLAGGLVAVLPRFTEAGFFENMLQHQISHFFGVPAIYARLMARLSEAPSLPHWRIAASGGAPLSPSRARELAKAWPQLRFFNTYGMTEVSSPATILPASQFHKHPESVGRPVPFASLRVVSLTTDEDVPTGEIGELWVRGPMVAQEYWQNPGETQARFHQGWIRSGDLARVDSAGLFYIVGRIKDIINRGAEKISPGEVEQVLYAHPGIDEASILGVPHDLWGEEVGALVVLKPGWSLSAEDIRTWVKEHLAPFKVPTSIAISSDMPRNENGKVDKSVVKLIILAGRDIMPRNEG